MGILFGLKTYLTISNGQEIQSPEFFKSNLKAIKSLNRQLSKKKKGSKNRRKSLKNLQRTHIDISNKRNDFEWKLAHELCKNHSFIALEDLNIEGMKKIWGRKVSDLSFSSFVLKLEQIANKYNTVVQKVDRWFASSKTCTCGVVNKELKLSDREWVCSSCGEIHSRDLLASNNILSEGIRLYRTKCETSILEAV